MNSFVNVTPEGRFSLDGRRWYCHSVIYYGHRPGSMRNWFTDDVWPYNQALLEEDFGKMQSVGINHAALFLCNEMFFDAGKPVRYGYDRLDEVLAVAKRHDVRLTLFLGGFIDNEETYFHVTGKQWTYGEHWFPSFNEALFDAYVQQMRPLAEKYKNEPGILGYTDRIDRFYKGFDNHTIPFNLKDEWASMLKAKFGTLANLREAAGGSLEGDPRDFNQVLMPQESRFNGSMQNPLAYEYVLWQKKAIGDTQARWDAAVAEIAPRQVFWTPFEGPSLDWAMLDGFTPETRKLHAIWMEYYHWQAIRSHPVNPTEWHHTGELITHRLHHDSPTIYNSAYLFTRYIKLATQRPVVICHGTRMDYPSSGAESETHQAALLDRVNAASLAADCDGWHYWCFTDDWQSSLAHRAEQKANPHELYFYGESMGLYDYDNHPRPAVSLVKMYTNELRRRARDAKPPARNETLLLSSVAVQYSVARRVAMPTASAVSGALTRLGVRCDYLWSAQNDHRITQETLDAYKLIVIADQHYGRDFADMPDKLLKFVENGGTLYFAMDRTDTFEDEHGVSRRSDALRKLTGAYDPAVTNWPGAGVPCRNWPNPYPTAKGPIPATGTEPMAQSFLHWGICPEFRQYSAVIQRHQFLSFYPLDGENFTPIHALPAGAEVVAVAKFPAGSLPLVYRHRLGKGTVYVNAWTNNVFRDTDHRPDYGGWDYDWVLAPAVETAALADVNLLDGAAVWLRNSWGYFGKEK